jgi:hypothetical protein
MKILGYLYLVSLLVTASFFIVATFIEHNFSEEHFVKIWWRKNIVGIVPDDIEL